ncbi:hypothetical protein Agub_g8922 [Astrephomene gubernaculifera]|uniref:NYN domain-containing protein n=1 Tax=Astrephomene gubernaculifera TaxID=47775 RepID=A0AAD3HNK2_9CHLO|nr:hypothetical protein Agub_g8922 [Astrephomene gubernaculifera]
MCRHAVAYSNMNALIDPRCSPQRRITRVVGSQSYPHLLPIPQSTPFTSRQRVASITAREIPSSLQSTAFCAKTREMGVAHCLARTADTQHATTAHGILSKDAQVSYTSRLQPPGAAAALQTLLQGRPVALLWDLDNVAFFAPATSAPLQLYRMRTLISEAGGRLLACRGYANEDTADRFAGVLPLLEQAGLMAVRRVPVRRDAADVRLVEDAMAFAATHGSAGAAIVCVSQDTDFAQPLRHLSERGIRTLVASPHAPRRRTHAVMQPATYFARLPLPLACWAALKWEPLPAPVTAAEVEGLAGAARQAAAAAAANAAAAAAANAGTVAASGSLGAGVPVTETNGAADRITGSTEAVAAAAERLPTTSTPAKDSNKGPKVLRHGNGMANSMGDIPLRTGVVDDGAVAGSVRLESVALSGLLQQPPGSLAVYGMGGGLQCPGTATRLWLNPAFCCRSLGFADADFGRQYH